MTSRSGCLSTADGEIQRALVDDEVQVLYRPVASSALDGVAGLRSEVRWRRPDHDVLASDRVIELATRSGDDAVLDAHVLADAARRLDEWAHTSDGTVVWASLIGASGLDALADAVVEAGRSCAAGRHRLGVRWPADAIVDADPQVLGAIRRAGVGIMAGDVTPGHPILDRLEDGAVDVVQLDAALVGAVTTSPAAVDETAEIIRMVARHGVPAVGAGVDHRDVLEIVERLGIDQVEGIVAGRAEPPLIVGMLLHQVLSHRP
ncbi:MAG: EAL domain-containing protein [Actinomycetota bacterium]